MTYKVLIVDDSEINALLAAEIVGAFGIETDVVASGEAAVDHARRNEYCFVLMDHIMPGMTGVEASAAIHGFSSVPIYAMTGDLNETVKALFRNAGAVGAITKPLNPLEVKSIIEQNVPTGAYIVPANLVEQQPAGSFVNLSRESRQEEKLYCGSTLRELAGSLDGIDYEKGLANAMGNTDSYLQVLGVASGNIAQYIGLVESSNLADVKLAVHSLKSVFANIGVKGLSEIAAGIESELNLILTSDRPELNEVIREEITGFIEMATDFSEKLAALLRNIASENDDEDASDDYEGELEETALKEVLDYIYDALAKCEVDYVIEGLEILKRHCGQEKRSRIKTALGEANSFEYDRVKEILDDLYGVDEQ